MTFVNARALEKENVNYNELRRKSFQLNIKLIAFLFGFANLTLLAFYIFPLVENKRKMPLPAYVPIDFYEHFLMYTITYVFVMFACWISALISPIGCLFFSSIIGFLSNEFKILGISYKEIFNKDLSSKQVCGKLRRNIIHHQELLRIFKIIQEVLYLPMLIQMGASCLLLSFTGFQMLTTNNVFSIKFLARVQHLSYTFFEFFIYCHQGEELMNQVKL